MLRLITIQIGAILLMLSFQNCSGVEGFKGDSALSESSYSDEDFRASSAASTCDYPTYRSELSPSQTSKGAVRQGERNPESENYAFAMYEVSSKTHGIGMKRKKATMEVRIPAGDKPVNLYLSSYEPVVWNLTGASWRVADVVLAGYHCQELRNRGVLMQAGKGGQRAGSVKRAYEIGVELFGSINKAQYIYSGEQLPNMRFVARDNLGPIEESPISSLACHYPMYPSELSPSQTSNGAVRRGESNPGSENYAFAMYQVSSDTHGIGMKRKKAPMEVRVPLGDKPVNLYLSSYEPTVWNITGAAWRVADVVLAGYHCQELRKRGVLMDSGKGGKRAGTVKRAYEVGVEHFGSIDKAQYIYSGEELRNIRFVARP